MTPPSRDQSEAERPSLQTQYEDLLDTVRKCERWTRVQDLIDAHTRFEQSWRNGFDHHVHGEGERSQE